MARTISDELKAIATSHTGSMPVCKIEVYPISGHVSHSKGLKLQILDGIEGTEVIREGYCPLVAFNWGQSPPLGVTPQMLTDGKTWTMNLTGYFCPQIPEGYTGGVKYSFGYVATGVVGFDLQGMTKRYSISPHSVSELGTVSGNADFLKLEVGYIRSDTSRQHRRLKNERFVLLWKDEIDDEWRIMGADMTVPPDADFANLVGTPVEAVTDTDFSTALGNTVTYILEIHKVGSTYHFHKDGESTEFPLTPGQTIKHNLSPGVAGGNFITITWGSNISDGDMAEVKIPKGLETPWTFTPASVEHTASEDAGSVLRFRVPVTSGGYNESNVTRDNMFTYSVSTNAYGILRPNRLVEFYAGYRVGGQAEYVKRFTGFVENVRPSHSKRSGSIEKTLDVTCIDARVQSVGQPVTKIEDMGISPLPNSLSYDIAGVFAEDIDPPGPNGAVRPPAFDSWNLARVVRTVLSQNGYLSSQLFAKDANDNLLIEDRGVYLERTPAYPHAVTSSTGARAELETEKTEAKYDWKLGFQFLRGYTQPKNTWRMYAETQDLPYLYQFNIDDDPLNELQELCQSYGLKLGQDADGNVYLRYPDNPVIQNTHIDDADGGTKASYTSSTLTDTSKNWANNHWRQGQVMITNGVGAGQVRRISRSTSTKLHVYPDWDTTPNNKSWYVVVKDEAFLSNNITYDNAWTQYPIPGQTNTDAQDFWALRCMYHVGGGLASSETTLENVGHTTDANIANAVWGDGTYIYVADWQYGLKAFTFNGSTFTQVGSIDDGGYARGLWYDGTYIYLANHDDGLRAYTFDGSTFTCVGHIDDGGTAYAVWGDGQYIYLANHLDGLRAYTFNGSSFTCVGHKTVTVNAYGVWGDGTYVYLANYTDGLYAFTFNGSTFTEVGHIDTGSAYGVWGDGSYVYLADYDYGLEAFTFNGTAFTLAGSINDGGTARRVWLQDNYICLANHSDGLRVYRFSGVSFTCVAHIDDGGTAYGIWGDGSYLYLANASDGLRAYTLDTTVYSATASVVFTGVGLKMIFPRPVSTSMCRIEIDGHVVNGESILDTATGDKGHTDWLDNVLDNSGKVCLSLLDLPSSVDPWFYRHGLHPQIGRNPALFTICDDLTYGTHVAVIKVMSGDVFIEGFATITNSRERSQHDFDARHDLSELSATESMAGHVNDVVVVGNMTGAAGDYITSRATDINAIGDSDAINFVGARKPLILSHPNIVNQERADYLAKHALMRYRRGERKPVVRSVGLPWLEPDDVITIKDGQIGYFAPWQLSKAQRLEAGKSQVAFGTYWIESLTERIDTSGGATSYTMEISATNRPPLPAFEPTPEPVQSEFYHAIDAFKMHIDGGGGTYNPFLEDAEGKYVNVEFALTWHARSLLVRVIASEHIDKVFAGGTELHLEPGDVIQTVMAQTGFVPAGKYECTWDGWMVVDESGGSGFYAPDGTYYIEIRTERYEGGEAFVYRSDSGMSNIKRSDSLEHIVISQDRDSVYGSSPFDVDITPSGSFENPAVVYEWETNDGQGIEFEVELDCPARLSIIINMKLMTLFGSTPPASLDDDYFRYDKATIEFRPDSTEILEPGTYKFYFKPALHTKVGPLPRSFWEIPESTTETDAQKSWWVCWYYSLYNAFCFQDLSGKREYINPTTVAFIWGGEYDGQYNAVNVHDTRGYYTFFKIK